MIDMKFLRENPTAVKENIRKKFQEDKLPLVDRVLTLDKENRETIQAAQDCVPSETPCPSRWAF